MINAFGSGARRLMRSVLLFACLGLATPALAVDSSSGSGSDGASVSTVSLSDAQSHIKRKRRKEAVGVLKQLIAVEPGNADALNLMGYSLRKSGDYRRAQSFYLKALKVKPKHRGANEYLGELYVETGQLAKARERLEALKAICGTDCEEYRELKQAIDAAGRNRPAASGPDVQGTFLSPRPSPPSLPRLQPEYAHGRRHASQPAAEARLSARLP